MIEIINYWKEQDLLNIELPSEYEISSFENKKGIRMSNDFQNYIRAINGMKECCDTDDNGFYFYSLKDLYLYDDKFENNGIMKQKLVIFADYFTEPWWYGVEFVSSTEAKVYLVLSEEDKPELIADSLSSFFLKYLKDDNSIYGS